MGISVPCKQGNVHCRSGRCFWARPLKGRDFQGASGGRGLEHCSRDAMRFGDKPPSPSETPKLATSCFAGRGQPLCSDPRHPTPQTAKAAHGPGVWGGRLEPPLREGARVAEKCDSGFIYNM